MIASYIRCALCPDYFENADLFYKHMLVEHKTIDTTKSTISFLLQFRLCKSCSEQVQHVNTADGSATVILNLCRRCCTLNSHISPEL